MISTANRFTGALAAFALTLGGCGGGDSSSGDPLANEPAPVSDVGPGNPAADDGGDTTPGAEKITVTGLVTDDPVPNARVVITVGGRAFEAPLRTSMDGSYSVEIESADPDALVFCEAVDATGTVRFAAVPNTFAELQASASDSLVSGMNITNVSTAHFVLAQRFVEDGVIESVDQLRAITGWIDTEQLLDVAAGIKLVVEAREGIVLPSGMADTLELAEALAAGSTSFLDDVRVTNAGALELAAIDVLTDGNATLAFDPASAPGVYVGARSDDVIAVFEDGAVMRLGDEVIGATRWGVEDDGRLRFDGTDGSSHLAVLAKSGAVANAVFSASGESASAFMTLERVDFEGGFDASGVPGTYASDSDAETVLAFSGGGGYEADALTGQPIADFAWEVSEGALRVSFADRTETLYQLAGSNRGRLLALVVTTDAADNTTGLALRTLERVE